MRARRHPLAAHRHRQVAAPARQLAAGARQVGQGDLSVKFSVDDQDELAVLAHAKSHRREQGDVLVKTSLMLGLGETRDEVLAVMRDEGR